MGSTLQQKNQAYTSKKTISRLKKLAVMKGFNFLLFILTLVSIFTQKTTAKELRQCRLLTPPDYNPFAELKNTAYKLEPKMLSALERDYVIFANAPMGSVEYFIFSEAHGSHLHQRLQQKYIPSLSRNKDYLLLENVPYLTHTSCPKGLKASSKLGKNLICMGWDNQAQPSREGIRTEVLKIMGKYNVIFSQKLAKSPAATLKALKMLLPLSTLSQPGLNYALFDQTEIPFLDKAFSQPTMLPHIIKNEIRIANRIANVVQHINPSEYLLNEYGKALGKDEVLALVNEVQKALAKYDMPTDLSARNKYAKKTFTKLACEESSAECQQKIVIGGAAHFFDIPKFTVVNVDGEEQYQYKGATTTTKKRELFFSRMAQWDNRAPHAELREFLETKKYAILYPAKG